MTYLLMFKIAKYRISYTAIFVVIMFASVFSESANTLYFQLNPNLSGSNDQRQMFLFSPAGTMGPFAITAAPAEY